MTSLYAFLNEGGYEVSQSDLNISFIHSLIKDERIAGIVSEVMEGEPGAEIRSSLSDYELEIFLANRHADTILKMTSRSNPERSMDQYFKGYRTFYNLIYLLAEKYGPVINAAAGLPTGAGFSYIRGLIDNIENEFVNEFYIPFLDSKLSDDDAELIGISIITPQDLFYAMATAKYFRKCNPGKRIVAGGPLLSYFAKQGEHLGALRDYFDFIIVYEGETALCELNEILEDESRWSSAPNLLYPHGEAYKLSKVCHVEDINSLPTPRFEGIPLEQYFVPQVFLPLVISKSCVHRCAFCGYNSNIAGKYRERSPEKIADDIALLKRLYDAQLIKFCASDLNPRSVVPIAEEIASHGVDISWSAQTRPEKDYLKRGVLEKMHESGCVSLEFGVESASKAVLKLMNKDIDIEIVPKLLKRCDELGMLKQVYILIGFPGESISELSETMQFMKEQHHLVDYYAIANYSLEFDSLVWRNPDKYGVKINYGIDDFLDRGVEAVDYRIEGQNGAYWKERERIKRDCIDWLEERGFVSFGEAHVLWSLLPPSQGWQEFAVKSGLYKMHGKLGVSEDMWFSWNDDDTIVEIQGDNADLLNLNTFARVTISEKRLSALNDEARHQKVADCLNRAESKYGIPREALNRTIGMLLMHGFIEMVEEPFPVRTATSED